MYINLKFPPIPYHIDTGPATLIPGMAYLSREKIYNFDLLAVFEGELFIWEDGIKYEVKAGEFLILEPNKKHYGYKPVAEETNFYWCHFDSPAPYKVTADRQSHFYVDMHDVKRVHLLSVPKFGKLQNAQTIEKLLEKVASFFTYTNSTYKLEQQILFHQILLQLATQNKSSTTAQVVKIAEETIQFLEQHVKEDVTYRMLSQHLHLSSAYITRCMKKTYGCTPLEYLQQIRMDTARNLLESTTYTMDEVARFCGFNTLSYFSKTFAQIHGISPLKYRKSFKEKM